MKQPFKKILSVILTSCMLLEINPIYCKSDKETSTSNTKLRVLAFVNGSVITCLAAGVVYQFVDGREKQDKIENLKRKIKQSNGGEPAERLHETWYTTYYCATKGILDNYDDWTAIAKKCVELSGANTKIRKNLDELLKYSSDRKISERDFVFNILAATYLSKYLPVGVLNDEIHSEFFPRLWLDRCDFRVTSDNSVSNQTFETCKKLTIDMFSAMIKSFDVRNPKEIRLRDMLQTEFIDVLNAADAL